MKATVLVTGAAGFIGSHVTSHLINAGYHVIALDDLSGGFIENINKKAVFIEGSVCDEILINDLFKKYNFEYVFHLAAYAAEGLSHFIRQFNYTNNLLGSINLINSAVKYECVKCLVFTSSIAVYGKNQLPMTEATTPMPEDPYGIAKYAIELDLKAAHEMFGLNYIIFRPHNVYGEFQNIADPYRNVVGIFMNQILQGKDLTIFGDGYQTRAFSYIDDVAPVIALSIENKKSYNEIYNIGADTPYSVKHLAEVVCTEMGVSSKIKFLDARNEVVHAYSAHEKVKIFFPELIQNVSLEEGIHKMAVWVKKTGAKKGQRFSNIELTKNLPPFWKQLSE